MAKAHVSLSVAYILKVQAITIRDDRYNNIKNNIQQLVTFILFSFHNICMLNKPFGGIRHFGDSSCLSFFYNLRSSLTSVGMPV
jgi:hypothetical protein